MSRVGGRHLSAARFNQLFMEVLGGTLAPYVLTELRHLIFSELISLFAGTNISCDGYLAWSGCNLTKDFSLTSVAAELSQMLPYPRHCSSRVSMSVKWEWLPAVSRCNWSFISCTLYKGMFYSCLKFPGKYQWWKRTSKTLLRWKEMMERMEERFVFNTCLYVSCDSVMT